MSSTELLYNINIEAVAYTSSKGVAQTTSGGGWVINWHNSSLFLLQKIMQPNQIEELVDLATIWVVGGHRLHPHFTGQGAAIRQGS